MGTLTIVKPTGVVSLTPNERTNSGYPGLIGEGWQKVNIGGGAGTSTDADLINGLILPSDFSAGYTGFLSNEGPAGSDINHTIIFNFSDLAAAIYSLDGAAPISFNSLPAGILFRLRVKAFFFSTACGGDINNHLKCQLGNSLEADVDSSNSWFLTDLSTIGFPVDPLDNFIEPNVFNGMLLKFINTYHNISCDLRLGNNPTTAITGLSITGEYLLESSQWTINPTDITLPDNTITISRPDPGVPPDEDTQRIKELKVNGKTVDPNDPWVIVWTRTTIIIHLNVEWIENQPPTILIEAQFIGTTFSGFVTLGTLTITYADLSGIYFLDIDAHSDTLYDRTSGISTVEVKIPAPFFVTAFFSDNEVDILHFGGTRIRVTGQGLLHQVLQSYDYVNTQILPDTILRIANNVNPFVLANFIDQQASLRIYMDVIRDNMNVSRILIFSVPMYTGYPQ